MNLSPVVSCLINSSGKRGDKSSGFTGSRVLGFNGGGGFTGRSAIRLYHFRGISTGFGSELKAALVLLTLESLRCTGLLLSGKDPSHFSSTTTRQIV